MIIATKGRVGGWPYYNLGTFELYHNVASHMQLINVSREGQSDASESGFYEGSFQFSGGSFIVLVVGMVTRFLVSLR